MTIYDFPIDIDDTRQPYHWLLKFTPAQSRVLEIGCATGFFSRYLVAHGCEVTGVEMNPTAVISARTICHHLIEGDIESSTTQAAVSGPFDVVICADVLEHLRQPAALLAHIRQHWLTDNGFLLMSMPNSGHWLFRREVMYGRFPANQYGLFDRTHRYFFTRQSLANLLQQTGYEVVNAGFTINFNSLDDITFVSLRRLYSYYRWRQWLLALEYRLAQWWPTLFVYQFVYQLQPIRS